MNVALYTWIIYRGTRCREKKYPSTFYHQLSIVDDRTGLTTEREINGAYRILFPDCHRQRPVATWADIDYKVCYHIRTSCSSRGLEFDACDADSPMCNRHDAKINDYCVYLPHDWKLISLRLRQCVHMTLPVPESLVHEIGDFLCERV